MPTLKQEDVECLASCAVDRTLEGDGGARWTLSRLVASYVCDPELDSTDLRIALDAWYSEYVGERK